MSSVNSSAAARKKALEREAMRLAKTFDDRTELGSDIIDAATLLPQLLDLLDAYWMTDEAAHEASQGAYIQAMSLEEQARNNPDPHRRRELLARGFTALAVANHLRRLAARPSIPTAGIPRELTTGGASSESDLSA